MKEILREFNSVEFLLRMTRFHSNDSMGVMTLSTLGLSKSANLGPRMTVCLLILISISKYINFQILYVDLIYFSDQRLS